MRRGWSGGISVLVDESVASGRSQDAEVRWAGVGGTAIGQRWPLVEAAVGPMFVVVVDVVGHEAFELVLVPDDGAVEQFPAYGSDPVGAEYSAVRVDQGKRGRC